MNITENTELVETTQHVVLNAASSSTNVNNKPITLTWRDLVVNAPVNVGCLNAIRAKLNISNAKDEQPNTKPIINHVDGIAKPSQILAIMGASGAGKTTLLNVLNFRNRGQLKVEGEVCVNGQLINSIDEIASISGYVQQDDLFVGSLTVRENLIFQAMLRMDRRFNGAERYERVEQVLQDLNLKKCENTPIGVELSKSISGGEKRRLAFASEVLTNPSILFCDEPTSGLDSFMAMSVVESMRSLALKGKTIVCTIHQPSSEVFELFDKLCLLAEGRLAFIGSLPSASLFFESQGYRVPYNYNPADFYIKNLAIAPSDKESSLKRVNIICDGFEKSSNNKELIDTIDFFCDNENSVRHPIINFNKELEYRTSFLTQMRWLLWRNWISEFRNPNALRIQLLQSIFIPILFGLIYFQLEMNQKGVQNISGLLFLCMANNSFGNMFVVINTFTSEIPIFYREHQNRAYRVISYYLSKLMMDLPLFTFIPFVFITICYWMANLNKDLDRYFICCGLIILVAQTAVSFGEFLSACSPSTNAAIALCGPVLVPQMIFAGFLLNLEDVPNYFLILRYVSWFGYASENLLINQFKDIRNVACDEPGQVECMKKFRNGDEILDFFKVEPTKFYFNLSCMVILILGWRIMTFLVLLIKSRQR